METPLVSIIVPVYNGSNYVAEALNSAVNQSYENLEIIIINDGSNDDGKTKEAVAPFLTDERVKYIEKPNGGVSSALNLGLSLMKGQFFCWLSHDDLMDLDSVSKRIKYWNKLGQDEKIIISTKVSYIDGSGNPIFRVAAKSRNIVDISDIISSTVYGCSMLIPYSLIKSFTFREDMIFMQDYYLWAQLINKGARIQLLNRKLTYNRIHGKQISIKRLDLLERDFGEFAKTFIDPLIGKKDYAQLRRICFTLEEHLSTRPFYKPFLQKYIFALMKAGEWSKKDSRKLKNSNFISWAVGKLRKTGAPVEMNNVLKKVVFISNFEIFHQTGLWDAFTKQNPDVDFTYLCTAPMPEKRKQQKYQELNRKYTKKSYEMSEEELRHLFTDVDIVVYGDCEDKRVEKYIPNAKHLVVESEHLSKRYHRGWLGDFLARFKYFNITHKNWKKMDKHLLALSYYSHDDFVNHGFKNHIYRFGYFPEIPYKVEEKDPFKILFYGRLLSWKRAKDAVFVLKFLKKKDSRYTLDIIGEGPEKQKLINLVHKWKLQDSVKFYPFMNKDEALDHVRKANIVVFPSNRCEGWGVALNEMLSQKAIVFANMNAGSSPYLVSKKNAFIYNNRRSLKQKLEIFSEMDEKQLNAVRDNAHKTVYQEWNNKNAACRLFELFTSIVRKETVFDKYEKGPVSPHANWHKKKISEETNLAKIEKKSKKNMAIGTIFGYLTVIIAILSGLILIPWILNPTSGIGEEAYGVYGLATSLIALFMLDFGLSQSLNTYLAKLRAKNDKAGVEKFIATVFKMYLILDIIFAAIIIGLYFLVDNIYIAYTQTQRDLLKPVLLIVGGFSLVNFPTTCFTSAITTYEKFGFAKFTEFANKLVYFILTIVSIKMGWGLIGLVSVNVAAGLMAVVMRFFYMRFYLGLKLRLFTKVDKKTVHDIFKLSVWALILGICARLIFNVTPSILGIVSKGDSGAEQGAIFGVISTIEGYIFTVSTIMSSFFMAKIARTDNENPEERQKHLQFLANKIGKLQFVVISIILIGYVSVGQEFLNFWMNRNDAFTTSIYFGIIVLCASEIINIPEVVFEQAMYTEGYIKPLAINSIVKAAVNLVLSFWLSYEFGAFGACIAIACARVVSLVLNNIVYKKYLHISFTSFFSSIYIRGAITVIISLFVGLSLHFFVPIADPKYKFLLDGIIVVILYLLLTFFVTFNGRERYYYFDSIKRLIGKGKPKYVRPQGEKIKIIQVVGEMVGGGVESFVMSYFKQLHNQFDFTFVVFDTSTNIPKKEIESLGGHIIIVPHVKHYFKFKKAFTNILKEQHYDIVHSHINTLSVFPLRIAAKCGVQIRIAHSHTTSSNKEFVRDAIKNFLKLFSKSFATHYFACSKQAGIYQFGKNAYRDGEITIIPNAVDIEKFKFSNYYRKQIRKKLGIKDNEILVGNFGRLQPQKNQQYILKIAGETQINYPRIKYLIVGSGDLEKDLKDNIKLQNLDNIIMIPNTKNINRFYSALDVFILPSIYEGLGLTAIEAQANGLYTVLSNFVPSETLLYGHGSYLPIKNNNVSSWVNEVSVRHKRVYNYREFKEEYYDIKISSKELARRYKQLA